LVLLIVGVAEVKRVKLAVSYINNYR